MHPADEARLDDAIAFLRQTDTTALLAEIVPELSSEDLAEIVKTCELRHAAVLVFPENSGEIDDALARRGLTAEEPKPSVVVKARLAARYRQSLSELDVQIRRVPVPLEGRRPLMIELFTLTVAPGSPLTAIADGERERNDEAHVALAIGQPDRMAISAMRSILSDHGWMRPDDGGYNRREGNTVLYFRDASARNHFVRRVELLTSGYYPAIIDAHRRNSVPAAKRLLTLMTGAWATQAIHVAAELKLADAIAGQPEATAAQLAETTASDVDSLTRLLRYLASIGVVTQSRRGTFELTELGRLLRIDADPALRPLALLYGGPFYESFGHFLHSVRTGEEAFDYHFGEHHFEYFAKRPELSELFDTAMASSAAMFGAVAEVVALDGVNRIVDVAGGTSPLLRRMLAAAPRARGVLFDRPHVLDGARPAFAQAGLSQRVEFLSGDFTEGVPAGGDVYLLSRVLHDWDDEMCRTILARISEAMAADGQLLVVERLIPEDRSASLAYAWDIHMLCNVGGRERTETEYASLLAAAGLELVGRHELPLDVHVLAARRAQ